MKKVIAQLGTGLLLASLISTAAFADTAKKATPATKGTKMAATKGTKTKGTKGTKTKGTKGTKTKGTKGKGAKATPKPAKGGKMSGGKMSGTKKM